MSAFRELRECSARFEEGLHRQAAQLFSVNVGDTDQEVVAKKLRDLSIYQSKFQLLHAKMKALTPQVQERVESGADVIKDYEDVAVQRVLEAAAVKSMTQSLTVKRFLTTPNSKLAPDLVERKEKMIELFDHLRSVESELRQLDEHLLDREEEHARTQREWDRELGEMRERRRAVVPRGHVEVSGPLYSKLQVLVHKMEQMRWLIGRLVVARSSYDWLQDAHDQLKVLALTRRENTVEMFMGENEL